MNTNLNNLDADMVERVDELAAGTARSATEGW